MGVVLGNTYFESEKNTEIPILESKEFRVQWRYAFGRRISVGTVAVQCPLWGSAGSVDDN